MPFEWIAALRFLGEGRMQTLFIIAGVSVGIAVIVFMSALLTGLQANLTKRVLSSQSHITLQPRDEIARPLRLGGKDLELAIVQMPLQRVRSIDQWQGLVRVLQDDPAVVAVSPVAAGSALAVRGDASRREGCRPAEDQRHAGRQQDAREDAREAAGDAEEDRLGEELQKDVQPARADGHRVIEKARVRRHDPARIHREIAAGPTRS